MKDIFRVISITLWLAYFPIFYSVMKSLWKGYEESYDSPLKLKFKIIGDVGTIAFLFPLALFSFLYYYDFEFLRKYRANDAEWPWKINKKQFIKDTKKHLKVYFFNSIILAPITVFVLLKLSKMKYTYDDFPSFFNFLWPFFIMQILDDFFFYWSHRILHHPKLYKFVHKQHHEFKVTLAWACIYAHPFEFIFGNQVTFMIPVLMMGDKIHLVTLTCFSFFKVVNTHFGHSGYMLPINLGGWLPYQVNPGFHDYHHYKNSGNYGAGTNIWDQLFKTNIFYLEDLKKNNQFYKQMIIFILKWNQNYQIRLKKNLQNLSLNQKENKSI